VINIGEEKMNVTLTDDDDIWNQLTELTTTNEPEPDPLCGKSTPGESALINDSEFICSNCQTINACSAADGELVCSQCSTLEKRYIDGNAEWRYYGYEDNKNNNPTRVGVPSSIFIPKSSLGTVIGTENIKSNGYEFHRIRRYQMFQSMPYKERSLLHVMENLNTNAANSGIPASIIEEAKMMYKKISDHSISRGENRNGLIASSVYMSCKSNKVPRSAKEIANMFNLKITTMTKGCKKFQDIMKVSTNSSNPYDFVMRFCSKLEKNDIIPLTKLVISKAEEYSIVSENAPPSIAAGCIYLVGVCCELGISKKDISKACEISEVTINKCFKKLFKYKTVIFPDDIKEKYRIGY
jgi:transcription initiation factor TFIIB